MKEPKVMEELHKIRENMSKLSEEEFDKRMKNTLEGWVDLIKERKSLLFFLLNHFCTHLLDGVF